MAVERIYTIETGPPAPDFRQYKTDVTDDYMNLLDSATDERQVQQFLEANPCLVPGAIAPGSHGPWLDMLISQPRLPDLAAKIPDFMWITRHSARWFPTLIEIETPHKALFTKRGVPTSEFTQARTQLAAWRSWFGDPTNVHKFMADYGIPESIVRGRTMEPRFFLVYGRRREFHENPQLSKLRSSLMPAFDEELMSFDRLAPTDGMQDAVTVRGTGHGRYQVLSVMPTIRLGPDAAKGLHRLVGLADAIERDDRISPERRDFLKRRIPYWLTWNEKPGFSVIGNDFE